MKDELNELLRQRFAGHESDVPAGAWANVQGRMEAHVNGDDLRDALQRKFHGHEVEPGPATWGRIDRQLGNGTGFSKGWLAAGVAAAGITAALLFWNQEPKTSPVTQVPAPEQAIPSPREPQPAAQATAPVASSASEVPAAPNDVKAPANAMKHAAAQQVPAATTAPAAEVHLPDPTAAVKEQPRTSAAGNEPQDRGEKVTPVSPVPSQTIAAPNNGPGTGQETAPSGPNEQADREQATDPPSPFNEGPATEEEQQDQVLIPTGFTPNGDGVNDRWQVVAPDCGKIEVVIVSTRTGNVVYRSNNVNESWEGRLPNGNIADEGFYSYVVSITDKEGHVLPVRKGTIQLFRHSR